MVVIAMPSCPEELSFSQRDTAICNNRSAITAIPAIHNERRSVFIVRGHGGGPIGLSFE